ncbi:MAG TPA: hypothetical protein VHE80_00120 [Acidimicrobiales bacterium]|nr:hypothetical protein [Acidimicrobiales bacterium]
MTDRKPEDQLAAELAREVVARVAPHEERIFGPISRAYFQDPDQAFKQHPREEKLGFGVESIAMLTPYALAIARPVVQLVIGELSKNLTERSTDAVLRWVRRLFGHGEGDPEAGDPEPAPQPLTSEQLSRVHALAFEKARELELPEREAARLADATVASLAMDPQ